MNFDALIAAALDLGAGIAAPVLQAEALGHTDSRSWLHYPLGNSAEPGLAEMLQLVEQSALPNLEAELLRQEASASHSIAATHRNGGDALTGLDPAGTDPLSADVTIPNSASAPLPYETVADAMLPESPAPQIVQVYAVRADVLAIEIEAGKTLPGEQVPFALAPTDWIDQDSSLWVVREEETLGSLVSPAQNLLYTFDQFVGEPLDTDWADRPDSYRIYASEGTTQALLPEAVFRKSKPIDMARVDRWDYEWPLRHTIYLDLPESLVQGWAYTIELPGSEFAPLTYWHDSHSVRSEAIHVSQIGFRPDDSLKVGYLSTWMGSGGGLHYPDGLKFHLVDGATAAIAYTGEATISRPLSQADDPRDRDYTLTEVHQLDFSEFTQPGRYRLCIEGIGCSFEFDIAETVWQSAFYTAARGFYHQRSGIALEQPYTDYERPRSFHPDDGLVVYQSNTTVMDTTKGIGHQNDFETLVMNRTDEVVENAWGGYYDAGDWDRHIQHLQVSRSLLELATLFPEYFAEFDLNIPESANALPDLIDEALWSLDFFARLQRPDGGIPGGIESAAHPRWGEASWQETLTVMMYAPDMWSSYIYAGVAARAAFALKDIDLERAEQYYQSALRAMDYAEQEYAAATEIPFQVHDERNLAAVELYRLTGEAQWHSIFLDTTVFTTPGADPFIYAEHVQRDAAFVYAQLPLTWTEPSIQQAARAGLLREAEMLGALTETTGFGWSKHHDYYPVGWGNGLGSPKAQSMLRAHALTGDQRYLTQTLRATQFSLGANPDNLVYTTGLGQRSPQHPMVADYRFMGVAPPPGITVYGPMDMMVYDSYWAVDLFESVAYPSPAAWPTVEGYFDVFNYPAVTEFTVMQSMVDAAYVWGYLAALD